jgi:hypothetical protein
MFDTDWTNETLAHRETEVAHEAFERSAEDIADLERSRDNWQRGLDEDGQPWRDPRLGEVEHCDGFDRYTLTADREAYADVVAAVRKLNNTMKRHGAEVRIVSEEEKIVEHPWMKKRVRAADGYGFTSVPMMVEMTVFTIEAPAVAGEKTKLVGAFELAEDGVQVYVKSVPGYSADDMKPFLDRWQSCEHCGFDRQRHASFVCEREDGTRTVIGRQCSKAYLGLSPSDLLARAAVAKTLSNGGDEEEGGFFGGSPGLHVATIMERAYRVAKHFHGYSKLIRDEFIQHMEALRGKKDERGSHEMANIRAMYAEKPPLEPMDLNAFADWLAEGYAKGDDFISNLYVAFSSEYVKPKRFNLIIAGVGIFVGRAIKAAEKALADKALKETLPAAKHADAAVGERFENVGVVLRTHPYATDWGAGLIISIRCDDGVNLLHFCKGEKVPDRGDRVKVKATVKKHESDKRSGEPQTVVSRAIYTKIEEQEG